MCKTVFNTFSSLLVRPIVQPMPEAANKLREHLATSISANSLAHTTVVVHNGSPEPPPTQQQKTTRPQLHIVMQRQIV
jgi:hypothetical protein